LVEVMRAAERRDRIAYQYTHDFIDVFELGLAAFAEGLRRDFTPAWAALGVYLAFLARFPDTHIRRKLGAATAAAVQRDGARLYQRYAACRQPQQLIEPLSAWDSSLKQRGINPGTSADLTVASLLTHRLLRLEQEHCEFEGWASAWSPHIIQRQTRRNSHGKNQ
jgi:triphosphoribosyl-dephospho-CoA synthase